MKNIELKDIILGGQDGLVNVLGLSLGLFAARASSHIILIGGLAAGISEAVAMGGVAYTSAIADKNRMGEKSGKLIFSAFIVGSSALIGSVFPIIPFIFLNPKESVPVALVISALILFCFGYGKAKVVGGNWLTSGLQILLIGLLSTLAGFGIGYLLQS